MSLKACLAALLVALAPGLVRALPVDKEVSIGPPTARLHGSLMTPEGWRGGPAVLLLSGSGPSDRNDNTPLPQVRPNTLRLLAQGLAANGIASLRIDKRCIGDSALACPGEDKLRLQTYADDARDWAAFLRRQPGVRCVVLLGHSEGALVGILAAPAVRPCGLVSVAGPGRRLDVTIEAQLKAAGVGPAVLARAAEIDAELRQGRTVADVPIGLMALYRPSVQPYLSSMFAVDPAQAMAAVKGPVLIVQGTTDIQVELQDAKLLATANPHAELVLLQGVNHVLKAAPAERQGNVLTYADPNLPLAPEVVPTIAGFVKKAASGH